MNSFHDGPASSHVTALLLLLLWFPETVLFAGGDSHRVVFGTSVAGTGDLETWPDADGAVGLAAGDAICQARAAAGGLDNPGNFVAWLSASSDDAYCRVHNLSGKVDVNCGQAQLPAAAGPWVRTDGFPLAGTIDQWIHPNNVMLTAIRYDEFGVELPQFAGFWTGTNRTGISQSSDDNCANWQDETLPFARIGFSYRTASNWSDGGSTHCGISVHLICIETQPGPALPPLDFEGRIAFLTAERGSGNLGDPMSWPDSGGETGVLAGDATCQAEAAAAGLADPGSYKAWLSDGGSMIDAADLFMHDGPWIRPDGVPVADNLADLTDGSLFAPINVTAAGDYLGNWAVWTGSSEAGLGTTFHCDSWQSDDPGDSGSRGTVNEVYFWYGPSTGPCNNEFGHLYCLSDAPVQQFLFRDGFETL